MRSIQPAPYLELEDFKTRFHRTLGHPLVQHSASACRSSFGAAYPVAPAGNLFRALGPPAFPAGHGSAPPFGKETFQFIDIVRK